MLDQNYSDLEKLSREVIAAELESHPKKDDKKNRRHSMDRLTKTLSPYEIENEKMDRLKHRSDRSDRNDRNDRSSKNDRSRNRPRSRYHKA
jgi:hypothetical protein